MNDIQVGDRVRDHLGHFAQLLAVDGAEAWVRYDEGGHVTISLNCLTRIEPERITLHPKYAVGQNVRTARNKTETVIKGIFITYGTSNLGTWDESELEPVPEPCDKCKGSGVASE